MTGSGRIITEAQDAGLEVLHEENLRPHCALTLRDWCANLVEHWDEAVAEVGQGTARVWGLYMAGSRLGFERNVVQLHQVLAMKADERAAVGPAATAMVAAVMPNPRNCGVCAGGCVCSATISPERSGMFLI